MNTERIFGNISRVSRAEGKNLFRSPVFLHIPNNDFTIDSIRYFISTAHLMGFTGESGELTLTEKPYTTLYYPLCGSCTIVHEDQGENYYDEQEMVGVLSLYQLVHQVTKVEPIQFDESPVINITGPTLPAMLTVRPIMVNTGTKHRIIWGGGEPNPRFIALRLSKLAALNQS